MEQNNYQLEVIKSLTLKAQKDPVWFIEKGMGFKLWEKQKEIVRALVKHERVAVDSCFGAGKTWIAAALTLWWLFNHYPSKVITTAPTLRQVKSLLWSEIRALHKRSARPLGGEPDNLQLQLAPDWFALGFATDEEKMDQFTGYHSPHILVVFDQACGIGRGIFQAAEGLMTGGHQRWLAITNTTDSTSAMAEISRCSCEGTRTPLGKWHMIKITAYDTPNVQAGKTVIPGIITHDWIDKRREVWDPSDPMWQIFVEANYVDEASMTVLNNNMIKQMFESELEPDFSDVRVSLDVADEGLDASVWMVRAGSRLLFIESVNGNNPMQVVAKTIEVIERAERMTGHPVVQIDVDKIGVGSGVVARLGELGYPVNGINVSVAPLGDQEQFLNMRAEMAWHIRNAYETICLNPLYQTHPRYLEMLREEMTIRYKLLGSGKVQLEPKKEVRKRLQRSCDFWDAMMLSFGHGDWTPRVYTAGEHQKKITPPEHRGTLLDPDLAGLFGRRPLYDSDFVDLEDPILQDFAGGVISIQRG